ncbi:MAG: hypothetical protein INH37_18480, partial [Myxococcaceae bacterium]|nr:hypothetical protein [Myxococcaceae bacterium]
TYPWMDRGGKNVFFTTVAASLYYLDAQGQPRSKYEAACLPGVTCNTQPTLQDIQVMQGTWPYQHMGVAGLWTHGKMVSVDSVLSHLDFPLFSGASQQRMLKLFTPGTGPATVADQSGWVQAGSGRASVLRPLSSSNGEMIESLESLFAFNPNFATRSPRDVVWLMSNGKATDEVEFDDYLDLDTLIFADMRASLTQDDPGYFGNNQRMHYRDGFRYDFAQGWNHRGEGFVGEKRLQNAATTLRLKTPAFGRLTSDPGYSSRIEPMALGGIKGKGLWLDSGSRVTWTLEPQPALTSQDWYVALFVDQRQTFQGDAADLLTFPNGGKVLTFNAQYVGYLSPQNELFFVALPPALAHQDKRYNHYAFALQDGGRRVDFYLNGLLFWTVQDDAPILAMGPGALVLGKSGARQGFRGWVDEVKVVARVPDAELACNHARGSLVGLTGPSPELSRALRYPPSTHAGISQALARRSRPTYAAYACHHDTLAPDGAPRRASVGVRLTQDFRFPEGPLVWSAPRPDSTGNAFCLTCHAAGQVGGLGLGALTRGTTPLIADPRRQPSMWPAFQSGNFPANFLAPGVPASHVTLAPPGVQGFDLWLFK